MRERRKRKQLFASDPPVGNTGNSAMQIAIFLSSLGFIRGGLETIAARFAGGLAGRGHQVICVGGAWPGRPLPGDLADLPVTWLRAPCLPPDLSWWPGASPRSRALRLKAQSLSFAATCRWRRPVRRLLASAEVTVSLLEIETVYLSTWRAGQRRPHVSYFPGVIDRHWLRRDRSTVRVAISQTMAEACRVEPEIHVDGVVTPGIDGRWLDLPYAIRPRARTVIFTGRLEANKGVWELLQIFRNLAPDFPDLCLYLLGDGPLRPALQRWVAGAGLGERIRFLGAVPAARVQRQLRQADLFLFPSRYESFGIAVLEAQAAGVPVVCSDLPATREAAGDAACLLPAGDIGQWTAAVRRLLADPAARERLSLAGRQHARQYTWDRVVAELERYLMLARAAARAD